jgi:hypothetical protein
MHASLQYHLHVCRQQSFLIQAHYLHKQKNQYRPYLVNVSMSITTSH